MESKELIENCLHAKAWPFICSRLENLWGGGSKWPPPLGKFVTVNSLVVRGLITNTGEMLPEDYLGGKYSITIEHTKSMLSNAIINCVRR